MAAVSNSKTVLHSDVQTLRCSPHLASANRCIESIDTLITRLTISSPFIVGAKLGPEVYKEKPFLVETINGRIPIYGWKPNSIRRETTAKCLFVLGARVQDGKEQVFYATAQHDRFAPGNYRRDPTDQKIYVVSLKRFQECVTSFAFPHVLPPPTCPSKK